MNESLRLDIENADRSGTLLIAKELLWAVARIANDIREEENLDGFADRAVEEIDWHVRKAEEYLDYLEGE